ncbi:MAG: SpoIIIAH-like family protein [Clostridiales bacterium]|nr:SpoIIIAH-like family protein [Clostridiales bacterium]
MRMKVWKKNAVLATVILFVCVAVYLNWSYGRGEAASEAGLEDQDKKGIVSQVDSNGEDVMEGESDNMVLDDISDGEDTLANVSAESDYFATARLNRQLARDSSLEILRESVGNESLSQEERDQAAQVMSVLAKNAITEAQIESLIKAKGFRECVAFIGEDGSIDVVVSAAGGKLQAEDVSRIKDIVISETGLSANDIKIIEVAE